MYHCFEELDDAVVILDRDNNVARLNGSFQETFGIGDDAAQGMEIGNLIARHLAPLFEEGDSVGRIIETLRCRREVSHVTCRMQPSHGGMRWFSFSCRVMTGEPYAGMMLIRFGMLLPTRQAAQAFRYGGTGRPD